ncbi:MAG: hypothetical protein EOP43_06340 [Sphingobacteriaceae bacterium]|nr:MAG: hypothetical protein EOP43_06340 [Sphingobacteriaceae bacterium]
MESQISKERFIINAENWSYKTLFTEAANHFNIKPPAQEAKPWMLEIAWRASVLGTVFTGKKMGVDKISAQSASRVQDYDNSKVKTALSFAFKPVKQSVREICETIKV